MMSRLLLNVTWYSMHPKYLSVSSLELFWIEEASASILWHIGCYTVLAVLIESM